jgi:hypothetical protein
MYCSYAFILGRTTTRWMPLIVRCNLPSTYFAPEQVTTTIQHERCYLTLQYFVAWYVFLYGFCMNCSSYRASSTVSFSLSSRSNCMYGLSPWQIRRLERMPPKSSSWLLKKTMYVTLYHCWCVRSCTILISPHLHAYSHFSCNVVCLRIDAVTGTC